MRSIQHATCPFVCLGPTEEHVLFGGNFGLGLMLKIKSMQDACSSQLELPVDLMKSTVLHKI